MNTGEKIKRYRELKGLTQKQLGVIVGLTDVRIRQYETNIRHPKEETLNKIANALEVDIGFLKCTDVYNLCHAISQIKDIINKYGKEMVMEVLDNMELCND